MAEPWTCPACDRTFARTGQKHVCARYYVEDHLDAASSAARRIYDAFVARLAECGPFELAPTRRQIGLRGSKRIFAGVSFKGDQLSGYLDLPRRVSSPRFRNVSDYTHQLWVHHFTITTVDELDDEFAGWMAESLRHRPGCVGPSAAVRADPAAS